MILLKIIILFYSLSVLGALSWYHKIEDEKFQHIGWPMDQQYVKHIMSILPVVNTLICIIYFMQLYADLIRKILHRKVLRALEGILKHNRSLLTQADNEKDIQDLTDSINTLEKLITAMKT